MKNFYEGGRGMAFWRRSYLLVITACLLIITASGSAFGQEIPRQEKSPKFEYDYERFPLVKTFIVEDHEFTPLKIGDKIPEQLWDMPLWVVNQSDGKDTIKLRDYEKEKLIVLDFWATWCSPCVQSMDTWNEYLKELKGEVAFFGVLVFDQSYKALPFTEWKGWDTPTVIAQSAHILNRFFFHKYVNSRLAWIKEGKLLAITNIKGYDLDLVKKLLANEIVILPNTLDWTY